MSDQNGAQRAPRSSHPGNQTPKQHPRVTHTIRPWKGRWRVDVALDGFNVRKAFFDDLDAARAGAVEMEQQVIKAVGLE